MTNFTKILMGKFGSPYGIHGWVRVISYTKPPANLLSLKPWFCANKDKNSHTELRVENARKHGKFILAKLADCNSPETAATYTNLEIFVERSKLPTLPANQYYWTDLKGLRVINTANAELGIVDHIMETGANDVIVVKNASNEYLIPYIKQVVVKVDLPSQLMVLDWDENY